MYDMSPVASSSLDWVSVECEGLQTRQAGQFVHFRQLENVVTMQVQHGQIG